MTAGPGPRVEGEVTPGFEEMRAVFAGILARHGEVGAACAVFRDGQPVVDLWGGRRDHRTGAPWREDTLVMMFSVTKGMAATALAVANSRGLLDYDERVAAYWPEFAQKGKGGITVRQLLGHQAGLPAFDRRIRIADMADRAGIAPILAEQRPAWEPGTRHGYHAVTLGLYEGELLRRVDPKGRSLGRFFAEEVAAPLGAEFYIGLPDQVPDERLARLKGYSPLQSAPELLRAPLAWLVASLDPRSLTFRAFFNPWVDLGREANSRRYLAIESPASNGVGRVRGVARIYASLAAGGQEVGMAPSTFQELTAPPRSPSRGTLDVITKDHPAYSLGFAKPAPALPFGFSSRAFGMAGLGGSFGYADPDAGIGYAFAPNRMRFYGSGVDTRDLALRRALARCLTRSEGS